MIAYNLFPLIIALYLYFRCLRLTPLSPLARLPIFLFAAAALYKNQIFFLLGQPFFAPTYPGWFLLTAGFFYGFFILLFLLLLARDIACLFYALFRFFRHRETHFQLRFERPLNTVLILLAALIALLSVWVTVIPPKARTVEIALAKLPEELDGVSCVFITDLHVSPAIGRAYVQKVVDRTLELKPDIIFFGGDLVDGTVAAHRDALEPLSQLKAPGGIFGCTGNHEYYSGVEAWLPVYKKLGITMLANSHRFVTLNGKQLAVIGVPDPAGMVPTDLKRALYGVPFTTPRILLRHRPDGVQEAVWNGIDLQLSGHTHGGMLWLMKPLIARFNGGYVSGRYTVGWTTLYVSNGTGVWIGFPLRWFVPAEITRIVLRKGALGQ
ncbi:MAG: metallophosphoesterase [Kiritimatiellae bacterium]|nr:metallophosphoesterase [Kiritimatiellia bacterium]